MNRTKDNSPAAVESAAGSDPIESVSTAGVLKIHERAPKDLMTLPSSQLENKVYDPVINLQTEQVIWTISLLGANRRGEVWLAITPDQKRCCAVKFFNEAVVVDTHKKAQAEYDNWEQVYGNDNLLPKCHVGYFGDDGKTRAYLCMPYVAEAPEHIRLFLVDANLGSSSLEGALRKFAAADVKQRVILWNHIGFFPKPKEQGIDEDSGQTFEVYLIGGGLLSEFEPDEDKEEWIQNTIDNLRSILLGHGGMAHFNMILQNMMGF